MAIKFNNDTGVEAVQFDDGSGTVKAVYGIQVNNGSATTKVWGMQRSLILLVSSHIDINSVKVTRTATGYEPSAPLGEITPVSRDPILQTVFYNVYFGDELFIEAIPDAGYRTSGTGAYTVPGGTTQIEKPLNTDTSNIDIYGLLTSQGLTATESITIENNGSSAVITTKIMGTKAIPAQAITATIPAGAQLPLSNTKTLSTLPTGDYTVTVSFTDGSYVSGTIRNQT